LEKALDRGWKRGRKKGGRKKRRKKRGRGLGKEPGKAPSEGLRASGERRFLLKKKIAGQEKFRSDSFGQDCWLSPRLGKKIRLNLS
jgi:hypothetical protein